MKGKLLLLAQYCFTGLLHRIFNCDKSEDIILTPDNVLNVLIYWSLFFCVITYTNYKVMSMVRFLWPTR